MLTSAKVKETLPREIKGWLGRGIDLFRCAPFDPPSTKPANLLKSLPQDFSGIETLMNTGYDEVYADSILEIAQKLTVEAGLKGSYGGFSGNVASKFSQTGERSEKRHLLQISFLASSSSYSIIKPKEELKSLLDDNFKIALATWNVDALFNTYGTHLIVKMIVGGRAQYFCQTSNLSSISETDFRAAAKAKYKQAGGSVEASGGSDKSDSKKEQLVSGSINIMTTGGDAKWAVQLKDGKWKQWVASIGANPGFLGFDKQNGLLPIWDLAATDERKTQIIKAYRIKAATKLRPEILSVTSEVTNHPVARVTVPAGFKLVGGGARENWIPGAGNLLTASFPETPNTWMAAGKDHSYASHNATDPASITAFAVAIYDPDDLWDVKISKSDAGNEDGFPRREQPVESGYVMVGGGAQVLWREPGNLLFASYALDAKTWRGHSKAHGIPSPATLVAYAIGLKSKLEGITVKVNIQQAQSYESGAPSATVSVASEPSKGVPDSEEVQDYVMTGGGACILHKEPGVLLTASYPKDDKTWEGIGKSHIDPCLTAIVVQCIGVKVGVTVGGA